MRYLDLKLIGAEMKVLFGAKRLQFSFVWFTVIGLLFASGSSVFSDEILMQDHQNALPVIAFVDVNVVPMDSERILYGQTVIVRGRKIDLIGPVSEVSVPRSAKLIGAKGRYLLPGLADMHVHNNTKDDFVLFLANGVTTIRNMWGAPKHLRWRKQIEAGELLGPTIYTTSPLM